MTCCGAPFCSCLSKFLFVLTISMSLTVKSSSERVEASNDTDGRTGGGGTGITCKMNQSGRACSGSRPSARQSSSEIAFKICNARSAVTITLRSPPSGNSSSSRCLNSAVIFIPSKRYCGCAVPVYGHTLLVLHASVSFFNRFFGFLIRINCANFGSSSLCSNNCEDEYPTHRRILNTTLMNP